jgi:hypothetical protein
MRNFRSNPAQRRDHYQELTDKIVAALEVGIAPWRTATVKRPREDGRSGRARRRRPSISTSRSKSRTKPRMAAPAGVIGNESKRSSCVRLLKQVLRRRSGGAARSLHVSWRAWEGTSGEGASVPGRSERVLTPRGQRENTPVEHPQRRTSIMKDGTRPAPAFSRQKAANTRHSCE